jgi:hypothetical protein
MRAGVYRPNTWPDDVLPGLQPAFKAMGSLTCHVADKLLRVCQKLVTRSDPGVSRSTSHHPAPCRHAGERCMMFVQHYEGTDRNAGKAYAIADACQQACPASLELMRADGPEQRCNKARLLHYLPMRSNPTRKDSWCGWHLDHGMLTGTLLNMPHRVCASQSLC